MNKHFLSFSLSSLIVNVYCTPQIVSDRYRKQFRSISSGKPIDTSLLKCKKYKIHKQENTINYVPATARYSQKFDCKFFHILFVFYMNGIRRNLIFRSQFNMAAYVGSESPRRVTFSIHIANKIKLTYRFQYETWLRLIFFCSGISRKGFC